ncbi:MAG: hypothetical protein JO107_12250 [Hyphomicrobiales bacterium]|nr:hypothetical protein [Hyphomicrobiales bacterium]
MSLVAAALRTRGLDPSLLFGRFDGATAEGRAKERQRRIALTALAAALAKVVSVSTTLISVPLTLHYLGAERYGLWMTMSSLVAMLGFADLGVGNGLLTAVAAANGRDDRAAIRGYVSSAFVALMLLAFGALTIFAAISTLIDWPSALNVSAPEARRDAAPALAALVGCFALGMPTGIVQKVQMGLQLGFMASLWQGLASATALIAVLAAVHWRASLPCLVLAFAGSPLLVGWLNGLVFFTRLAPDLAPVWRAVSVRGMRSVMGTGVLFFVLQLIGAFAFTSDNIIVARVSGPVAVAEYAVPVQMFAPVTTVLLMALSPLWPAYGEAIARGDGAWARRTLKRSLALSVAVASVLSLLLATAGPRLLALWVGSAVAPPASLLFALAIWKVVETGGAAVAMFLNGAKVIAFQVIAGLAFAALAIPMKIVLLRALGSAGIVIATTVAYLICVAGPLFLLRRRILRGVSWQP